MVTAVDTLNVENCFITGFGSGAGILMASGGRYNIKGTDVTACDTGAAISTSSGLAQVSVDHCHFDGNLEGYFATTTSPGGSITTATYSTANNNTDAGWIGGNVNTGKEILNLEFCSGSNNAAAGLFSGSPNVLSVVRYSNCVFANNGTFGVERFNTGTMESRGNNTLTGNATANTGGVIGTFPPM
jgi:hypothetical protein